MDVVKVCEVHVSVFLFFLLFHFLRHITVVFTLQFDSRKEDSA